MATMLKICIFPSVLIDILLGSAAPFTMLCRAHSFLLGWQAEQDMGGRDLRRQLLQVVVLQWWPWNFLACYSQLCFTCSNLLQQSSLRGGKSNIQIILSNSCIFHRKNNFQHHLIFLQQPKVCFSKETRKLRTT